MMNKRYYSFETMFRSLKDELRAYLKGAGIYYELSGCGAGWHFEIKMTEEEMRKANAWLDTVTITEQRA